MGLIAYFGYGSLVNVDTLRTNAIAIAPARLKGWRRHWQARPSGIDGANNRDIALLSVHSHEEAEIDGVVVIDRVESLPELDKREQHYRRVDILADHLSLLGDFQPLSEHDLSQSQMVAATSNAFIYCGNLPDRGDGQPNLLQSYLDAVLAGFAAMHGEGGMERFVASTIGFERQMIVDRHQPVYPRPVRLDEETARAHDALLARAGVKWLPSSG